ncbi:MAG TPA: FGGY family carbohydrate kinase [Pseudonocardia sp.]|uniref:FGGY-family carbohydrate kinase n=1 Tax=Pseudonocardia sp. TaxID=60912 RepID=UPI002B4AC9BC|nr:FGGY family carbohydrate kinase [Pseudonocardia sp.]HLU55765.1 FGGY family carbohydrate kinase [Pseudonocardia sp.]
MPDPAPVDSPLWLGIDLGTQGVRAVLVDGSGAVVGSGSAALRSDVRTGDRHEQDPDDWWRATCLATREALAGRDRRPVGGVSIDSTSGTLVVQDSRGRAVGPALMYDDRRAAAEAARVQDEGEELWTALGYRMQASWALPKVVWLAGRNAVPAGHRLAHQADHIGARLAGHPVPTDYSHALKTGYDLLGDAWPAAVLDRLGIDPELLPPVVAPGERVAVVSAAAAEETGIPAGTPIVAGMTDGCAAQVATAALAPGQWCSALGTTLVLKGSTTELLHDPTGAVYCHRNPDGGWLPGGASSTGAGVLASELAGADLDALTERARDRGVPAGATYPLVGRGERFPFVADAAEGFDVDGPAEPDLVDRFNRVAHGVAYVERLAFEVLAGLGADVSGPVVATGGTSRNDWWTQLRADVLQRPVAVPEHAGSAIGSAVLAAAPRGRLAATAAEMVRVRRRFDPNPARADELTEGYRRLVEALEDRGWLELRAAAGGAA